MVWGLAAALAAGIAGDPRILAAALFFCLRFGLSQRGGSAGHAKRVMVMHAALGVLVFCYGYLSITAFDTRTKLFDSAGETGERRGARGGELCLDGWVASYPHYQYGGMAFEFETRVGGREGFDARVLVKTKEYAVGFGDSLRVCGRVYHGKDERRESYARYLKGRGLEGEVRVPPGNVEWLGGSAGNPLVRHFFWPVHQRVRCDLVRGLGARAGIPVALLIGERGFLGRATPRLFATLGLSHMLALSGLHLGFVAGALYLVFRLIGFRSGLLLIAVLSIYVGVVGFIVSLTRALVMAALLITASMMRRPLRPVSALGNALFLLLLFSPMSFFSLGFQLSFLATYGVLRCVSLLRPAEAGAGRLRRFWIGVRSSLLVSISAQAFVAPLIIHYFERISVVSPVATLVFVLPVAVVLGGSGVCALLASLWPAGGALGFWVFERILVCFESLVGWAVAVAPERAVLPSPDVYFYYAGLVVLYRPNGGKRTVALGFGLLAISAASKMFF